MKLDKQQRYLSIKIKYVTDVLYIRGEEENIVADCLSRSVSVDLCDLPAIRESQKRDEEIHI